jgi:hypothetical protein
MRDRLPWRLSNKINCLVTCQIDFGVIDTKFLVGDGGKEGSGCVRRGVRHEHGDRQESDRARTKSQR